MKKLPMSQESLHPQLSSIEIETELKKAGLRPTVQRCIISDYVLNHAEHPSVETIKTWVDKHYTGISLATVYNTVHALESAGLVHAIRFDHSDKVFYDTNTTLHHHFLDEKTGELIDIDPDKIEVNAKLSEGMSINEISVLIRGERA